MKRMFALVLALSLMLCACASEKNTVEPVAPPTVMPVEHPEPEIVEKRLSFYGVGDNLIHNCVYWQADANAEGPEFDFKPMYQMVAEDIRSADIAYINQETVLGGTELTLSSYPLFNSPQELGRDMMELGFDVFSHATNHVFDKGLAGIENTYAFYEGKDAICVGIHKAGEESIKLTEKNGITVAFLNYTYLTNGFSGSDSWQYRVSLADEETMISDIARAKTMADFVVCFVHWGDEGQTTPNDLQRQQAALLSEAGCDVIIGTHPHVIQPVEFVGDTLVVYSLGNFISAQKNPVNLVGGTVKFDLVLTGEEKSIENVQFLPVINQYEAGFSNIRIIPFGDYSPELAQAHGAGVSYEYFENLIAENAAQSQLTP